MTATDETLADEIIIDLKKDDVIKEKLADMLKNSMHPPATRKPHGGVLIPRLFPRFIRVQGKEKTEAAWQLLPDIPGSKMGYSNTTFVLKKDNFSSTWWELSEVVGRDVFYPYHLANASEPVDFLTIIALNDKVVPQELSWFAGYGVIGLYASMVLVVSQFLRQYVTNLYSTIMFEELPYVDRILSLCLDIYLVRECKDMEVEEDLYERLVFLYRSPSLLIQWTMPPSRPRARRRATMWTLMEAMQVGGASGAGVEPGRDDDDEDDDDEDDDDEDDDDSYNPSKAEDNIQLTRRRRSPVIDDAPGTGALSSSRGSPSSTA